jgi:hypothetical protein
MGGVVVGQTQLLAPFRDPQNCTHCRGNIGMNLKLVPK